MDFLTLILSFCLPSFLGHPFVLRRGRDVVAMLGLGARDPLDVGHELVLPDRGEQPVDAPLLLRRECRVRDVRDLHEPLDIGHRGH